MKRWISSSALLGFLIATALILSWTTGGPAMPKLPSWNVIGERLSSTYLPAEAITRVLGLLGWTLWFYIVGSLILRALAHLAARLGLPGAPQLVRLSDTVTPPQLRRLFDIALGGALVLSALTGPKYVAGTPAITRDPIVAIHSNGSASAAPSSPNVPVESEAHPVRTYEVKPGDSLWRIAERELGSGPRWKEIFDLNAGRDMGNDRRLDKARLICPGWILILPSDLEISIPTAASVEVPAEPASPTMIPSAQPSAAPPVHVTTNGQANESGAEVHDKQSPPIQVELPDGGAMAASFAAGLLAASALGRLRRRRVLRLDASTPKASTGPAVRTALNYRIDPSVDVIGQTSEAVVRLVADRTGEIPAILAAWEDPGRTTFLLTGERLEDLPASHATATGQRIVFDSSEGSYRAVVTGPRLARLRPSPRASADGLLVPVGFSDTGIFYFPLLGSSIGFSGPRADSLVEATLLAAMARLGSSSIRVIASTDLCRSITAECVAQGNWVEEIKVLERESLRRKRLFSESGANAFADFLLSRPDDQLPVIIVVVEAESAASIGPRLHALSSSGIAVLIVGEGAVAARLLTTTDDECDVQLPDLSESIRLIPALLPPEVVAEAASLLTDETDVADHTPIEESAIDPRDEEEADLPYTAPTDGSELSRVFCLGSFRVEVDGEVVEKGWRQRERELLALLIANPAGLMRDRIFETLWPEEDPLEKEPLFWRHTSDLRGKLRGKDGTADIVVRLDELYRLDWEHVWVDVAAFEESIRLAKNSDGPDSDLRRALELYRGDFLVDMYYDWAEDFRTQLRNMFVKAVLRLVEVLESKEEFTDALDAIDRAIGVEKYAEVLYVRAMQLESRAGRRDALVRRYRRLQQVLEDLDLEPAAETVELFNSLARPLVPSGP